jgi:ribonuclease BN (tRNA processing enzyme)
VASLPRQSTPLARQSGQRIVFVGTGGGAHPTRCHAAIAIQVTPERVLLLDTGGGFEVVAGLQRAGVPLGAVTRIFLSHRHSDHLLGLEPLLLHIGLQAMWSGRPAPAVQVYGAPAVLDAARTLLDVVASYAIQFIEDGGGRVEWRDLHAGQSVELWPDAQLTSFLADHIPDDGTNLGCAVDLRPAAHPEGMRLVYSGDSRPTAALRRAAAAADVLIHEAGGVDAQQERVAMAGHSTAGEAARQARAAGVTRLFLHHVPDDAGVPALLAEARRHFPGPVCVPQDGDSVPLFVPAREAPRAAQARPEAPGGAPEPACRQFACGVTAGAESPPSPPPGA